MAKFIHAFKHGKAPIMKVDLGIDWSCKTPKFTVTVDRMVVYHGRSFTTAGQIAGEYSAMMRAQMRKQS